MIRHHRLLLIPVLLLFAQVHGQGGIRAIFWNYEPVFDGTSRSVGHYGIGYDHDLADRLSIGADLRYAPDGGGWCLQYRSAYHFSDTESSSFYLGPTIGYRKPDVSPARALVPLGLRIGVRGGLERFYADIHAGFLYQIGGDQRGIIDGSFHAATTRGATFCLGLEMGWGWEGRSR